MLRLTFWLLHMLVFLRECSFCHKNAPFPFLLVNPYFTHFLSFLFSCFSECKAGLPPIFETQLSLEIPELVFYPSLESGVKGGFYDIVEGLVASIFRISSLIPRLSPQNSSPHYQVLDL